LANLNFTRHLANVSLRDVDFGYSSDVNKSTGVTRVPLLLPRNFRHFLGLTLGLLLPLLSPSISGSDSHFRVSGMLDSRRGIP
jgi:hypothetical protein